MRKVINQYYRRQMRTNNLENDLMSFNINITIRHMTKHIYKSNFDQHTEVVIGTFPL